MLNKSQLNIKMTGMRGLSGQKIVLNQISVVKVKELENVRIMGKLAMEIV